MMRNIGALVILAIKLSGACAFAPLTSLSRIQVRYLKAYGSGIPAQYASRSPAADSSELVSKNADSIEHADAVVCGGGPAGLLAAIMLAQKLPSSTSIRVYDRLSEPPNPDDEMVWSDVGELALGA